MSKTDIPNSLIVKSSVEQAIEGANEKKNNRLHYGVSPEKAQLTGNIVKNSLGNLLVSLTQPKCARDNLDEIKTRTVEYLQRCVEAHCIPLIEDWAVALGLNRSTMYKWFDRPGTPEIGDFLEKVRTSIYAANAQAAYQNAINCVSWIFYAKNSLGMTDKTEIAVSANTDREDVETASPEELRRKYLEAVDTGEQYE